MAHAKTHLRARARELRLQGWTYDRVRDLPKPEPRYTPEEQRALMNAGLARLREAQEEERKRIRADAAREIGDLTDRELFMTGVALYWAEGSKSKPYDRRERVAFVNSDPGVISVFLA
jgi:hypothetical protein